MKPAILTSYSESHAPLFREHFMPSFFSTGMDRSFDIFDLHVESPQGKYGTHEFNSYTHGLMVEFLEFMRSRPGSVIIHAGCDIRFYQDISKEILAGVEEHELLAIDDNFGLACCDFFAFKVTERICGMYEWAISNDHLFPNNEFAFNHAMRGIGIKNKILPIEYYTVGLTNGGKVWTPGHPVNPPKGMKLHHGNFTIGVENKMILMDAVLNCHSNIPSQAFEL